MKLKGKKRRRIALAVLLTLAAVVSAASLLFIKLNFDDTFARTALQERTAFLRYADVADRYPRELLDFPSGENRLQGYLYGADGGRGLVVVSHGLGGGAEGYLAETLFFVDQGYAVFAYDNTGCCGSEGETCVGLNQSVLDLDAALTYLEGEERFVGLPVFLFGHSWGGYAVTAIFHFDHDIAASASVAGFNRPMTMILEWIRDSMGPLAYIEYPYIAVYQKLLFGKNAGLTAVDALNCTDTPVLIVHDIGDTTVTCGGAGIAAYRAEITNPNVRYRICDTGRPNPHTDLFRSIDALAYYEEIDGRYQALYDQYGGEIPDEVDQAFYDGIDKLRMSAVDESFLADVQAFFEGAAGTADAENFKRSTE